jgi:DNA polymerase-3 subunit delta
MTAEEIISGLKNRIFKPVYLLHGEEPYYIDLVTEFILANVLSEAEQAFNQLVFYGKDTEASTVINAAKRYPMMSEYQVVALKEGQDMKNFDDLFYYLENPLKSTILVINYKYKSVDKRKKAYKAVEKNGLVFESSKIYENKIPAWIEEYLSDRGYKMDPGVGILLTDYLGNDLTKITNELQKLMIVLPASEKQIRAEHIEKYIGISKDYNNFELQKALVKKDLVKANRIINYFAENQKDNHISLTITSLYFFFSKLLNYHYLKDKSRKNAASELGIHTFFVQEYEAAARVYSPVKIAGIVSLLREYDMKSKGMPNVSTSAGDLLKELVYHIMH